MVKNILKLVYFDLWYYFAVSDIGQEHVIPEFIKEEF